MKFLKMVRDAIGGAIVVLFCIAIILIVKFYATGEPRPDGHTGRTFRLDFHGPLYVHPQEGHLFISVLAIEAILVVAVVMLSRTLSHAHKD